MLIGPQNLVLQLTEVRSRINRAAQAASRDPSSVVLVAVTKSKPVDLIRAAAGLGVGDFGENYVQEAAPKIDALKELNLTWHFIGAIQSNKTREIAERFSWVHSVDRLKIAQRLSEQRPFHAPALQICIQVALVPEDAKGGVDPAGLPALAARICELPRLKLRGLMCIPPPVKDESAQRAFFEQMAGLREDLNASGLKLDTLSMGMSDDFEAAIRAGATMVRIGSAIFGSR
jgi:pyridoxal phosphate enzyme (YggS family)